LNHAAGINPRRRQALIADEPSLDPPTLNCELTTPEEHDRERFGRALRAAGAFLALLWIIKAGEALAGADLARFGITPRQMSGLPGILVAPLIHGSWAHLGANSLPLLVIGSSLLFGYPRAARIVLPAVYLGTGLAVWCFARPAYHIGASGLTFGMMFFVFTVGALRWDRRAIALSCLVFFLYGGMLWGVFPTGPGISFETHLFAALMGVVLAIVLRRHDPPPPEKKYSWERVEEKGEGDG